jgi:hypothetical protein
VHVQRDKARIDAIEGSAKGVDKAIWKLAEAKAHRRDQAGGQLGATMSAASLGTAMSAQVSAARRVCRCTSYCSTELDHVLPRAAQSSIPAEAAPQGGVGSETAELIRRRREVSWARLRSCTSSNLGPQITRAQSCAIYKNCSLYF